MIKLAVWGLLPFGLFFAGCMLLWIASWRRQSSGASNPFASQSSVMTVFGWLGVIGGGLGITVSTVLFFAPLVLVIAAVVLVSGVLRYWKSECLYLVWMLAEAAERSIPLEKAARAFAGERRGRVGVSARRLADYLDAGMLLSVAIVRSGIWVSADVRLAADIGERTGTLGPSLRRAVDQANAFDNTLGALLAKFFYLALIVNAMFLIVTFLMIKIVPTFEQMFEEFGLCLPTATILLIGVSRFVVEYWFLLAPFLLLFGIATVFGLLVYMGMPLQSLPFVRRFARPIDSATVLGSLALAVHRGQPITDSLVMLSSFSRSPQSREQLGLVVGQIESGMHWSDSLRGVGLISAAQNAVLQSAERAGNLGWALSEMGDSILRRAAHRAQAILNLFFPVCVTAFGLCVLFIAIGMLAPLFFLIGGLA